MDPWKASTSEKSSTTLYGAIVVTIAKAVLPFEMGVLSLAQVKFTVNFQ